ncbi:hypothetical protein [uncultured Klebsiella sp.]|uniref:hypothetical protein n=1 Tax=uncultured Klebsiella sp. TaxID=284011 RepID=UPI002804074C|nr:hypothetical protein [uncultured Klebsiella sp.]
MQPERLTATGDFLVASGRYQYLVEKKTAGDQRADNQQDQDELKTIALQHGCSPEKTALKETAPI